MSPIIETNEPKERPERDKQADSEHKRGYPGELTWQRETTYQMFQAMCSFGKCEENPWVGDRMQYEPDAWGSLQGHLRHEHYNMVRLTKVRRTSRYEVVEE